MYRRRLSQTFPTYPNLKILLLENKNLSEQCYRITLMLRQISAANNVKQRLELILKNSKLFGVLKDKFSAVPRSLKDQSSSVLRVWAHQFECVMAHRLRRGQQMFCLYSKLWEERALREFLRQMRQRIGVKSRDFLVAALGVAAYDWSSNRIPESEIRRHSKELEYVYKLKEKTLCNKCIKNSRICQCQKPSDSIEKPKLASYDDWKLFIEKNDLVVWRRLHSSGNYEYKVYGSYADVSAEDFLNVQIDIDYRRQWDNTAVVLNIVEADPDPHSHSDIIYWEMQWPTLFANRDYVFNRRYLVDYKAKTLFLVSKSTKHPSCPKQQTKYRIEDYWSYMVIRPYTELNKPGIEFSLTYFDNPGVNIPASVTTWVAMKAMPDFLERLREASRKYKVYCKESGVCSICNILDSHENNREPYQWDYFEDDVTDNTIYEAHHKIKAPEMDTKPSNPPPKSDGDVDGTTNTSANVQSENHSFWRYLHPTYYFS
ncbi:stAR-related lipid transfer protein 7, mitochondrial isoform X1 [Tribolium castaneum]|uniref:Phosphatidylcholine transfer protein n=1 Tax=Tribolium castaneum TaxID=7070 RepID=A0A139WNR7_TRICA|nr:PREDICTED: stAR-related lipid transfer protein 7, mitochondrial isoform X1 [Tribolium castaneum]KYB29415.1 StAR-related lipid transfer protein 7, mitochondrial-like Protein [Tribolium castaneum]|eukprot:XP_967394.1 PREDICTED: stAR-related lipid transfer protein 7, mitochondrial isoform X1 [Tribolium castaneum]